MSRIENLEFRQGEFQISIPQMEIQESGVTALTGPSGSGKSTLVRVLLGLEKAKGWRWNFKGRDISQLDVRERRFAVVFQDLDLFPHMSAYENILFVAQSRISESGERKKFTEFLLDRLGIQSIKKQRPFELSGGEKQRVALARALVSRPDFLFLDEPFSSLDVPMRKESRKLVGEILKENQTPALLISHDLEDVQALASLVHVMEHGKLRR